MEKNQLIPPVAVHVIWHRKDAEKAEPLLELLQNVLHRDVHLPLSNAVDVPLYYYNTDNVTIKGAMDLPTMKAKRDVILPILSPNFVGDPGGRDYLVALSNLKTLVPVWLDSNVGKIGVDCFDSLNAIRLYDYEDATRNLWGALLMAHEICRHGFDVNPSDEVGKSFSMKMFLSHAKSDKSAEDLVNKVKALIQQTNLSEFYDKTEISPGFRFDSEIASHIKVSTLIAFRGCKYASRYWCQKELLCAKENNRPMVVCDILDGVEDRGFVGLTNIPSMRIEANKCSRVDLLQLLLLAVKEAIRCRYVLEQNRSILAYRGVSDCDVLVRPPEAALTCVPSIRRKVCYPDPPVFSDELAWCSSLGVDAFTPMWNSKTDLKKLTGLRVGISASESCEKGYGTHHVQSDAWMRVAQDLGRNILLRNGILIYGGDMRKGGVTEFLLEEAARLKDNNDFAEEIRPVVNYLSWPLYNKEDEMCLWRNAYLRVMESICVGPADVIKDKVRDTDFLLPNTIENNMARALSLTKMRNEMIESSDVRVCIGGRANGFGGSMPGVLEEILIALDKKKPLFLLGGFGGMVANVCDVICGKDSKVLSQEWQMYNNVGYSSLLLRLMDKGVDIDFTKIQSRIKALTVAGLAEFSGLSTEKYARLMHSDTIEECVLLVDEGLSAIARKRREGNV